MTQASFANRVVLVTGANSGIQFAPSIRIPLGRMGAAEEVARWVVALGDPNATWVTGQVRSIDGGMSLP